MQHRKPVQSVHSRQSHAPASQRARAARQAEVAALLDHYSTTRTNQSAATHAQLRDSAAARQAEVAALLDHYSTTRTSQSAATQAQLRDSAAARQAEVAALLDSYGGTLERSAANPRSQLQLGRSAQHQPTGVSVPAAAPAPAPLLSPPVAPAPVVMAASAPAFAVSAQVPLPPAPALDQGQWLSQVGLVAYAQMVRVAVLRAVEGGAFSDAPQQQLIESYVDGLVANVRPFLSELHAAQPRPDAERRVQLSEIVEGVRRTVTALCDELRAAPWPTSPHLRQAFGSITERLYQRLDPLHDELDAAAQALQADEARSRATRRGRDEAQSAPGGRSYRDNLTSIHGIGPALQQRLNRAGICTYIQLALSSPEDVRKAIGEQARLASVEDWIVQARSLAGLPA